ncbi:MAG: metallophosphoesterase [Bacteroidota bacterium]|nr:metallophosphoesterase [Bacteroidota bacterium]
MIHSKNYKLLAVCIAALMFCLVVLGIACNKNSSSSSTNSDNDSLSFIVMGDWGKDGAEFQKPVADQLDVYSRKFHAQFIVTTGDNFYLYGVASTTDPHWKASFEDIYNKEGHQLPWYPSLGNHDYGLNPQAQVMYSAISNRWKMPARYYSIKKSIDSSHAVLLAFTDTSPFVSSYYGQSMADLDTQDTAAQVKWLRQTLLTSNETWKIAIGHHPVYSSGLHGNTPELISRFKPIFVQSKLDFYLCGHDHTLEYIFNPSEPVRYLVSGGGSENTPVLGSSNTLFAKSSPGFLVMTLYANKANFYYYNQLGTLLYQTQVKK